MKKTIPEFSAFLKSHPWDSSDWDPPGWIEEKRKLIRAEMHRRKRAFTRWIRQGVLCQQVEASYCLGPFDLPVDFFVTSRWHERRLQLPLACDWESWRTAWLWWRGARSYRGIKVHIERYGMRKPIWAEWFVNYDPEENKLIHQAFSYRGENLKWPFLILRTGNERLMMAQFEWDWHTVPVLIFVKDCGHSKAFSVLLKAVLELYVPKEFRRSRFICRESTDRGIEFKGVEDACNRA